MWRKAISNSRKVLVSSFSVRLSGPGRMRFGGFATINHFEEAIYVKNYAWWILTWRFYSALAGTPKKSVKVRGLDHPNMTGDFRKSGGYWIHKSTKSLDSKFLSGTPERGSGDSKTSDVILLANDIWAAKSWNKRDPALYDNLWKIEMIIEDTAFLIVNHPLAMIKHTLTFPPKQHILSNIAYYHVFQSCVGLKKYRTLGFPLKKKGWWFFRIQRGWMELLMIFLKLFHRHLGGISW